MITIKRISTAETLVLDTIGIITGFEKETPSVQTKMISIPGRSGDIDASEALTGYPIYNNRKITISMTIIGDSPSTCEEKYEELTSLCHGQQCEISCDFIPGYHFVGRLVVSVNDNKKTFGKVKITADCEPYAYKNAKTIKNIAVGEVSVSSDMPTDIIIKATSTVKGTYEGNAFEFSVGEHKINYPKLLGSKTISITQGAGTIEYQEGKL